MSNATLAIYLGESYAELEVRVPATDSSKADKTLLHKKVFLPQTPLKSLLQSHIKPLLSDNLTINKVYVVCRYFERLTQFRLGGSVVQVQSADQANNYVSENSKNLSLAAAALIISIPEKFDHSFLETELARIKKINPEANKVVISLGEEFNPADQEKITTFFIQNEFKIFRNDQPDSLAHLRRTLVNAGTEGTKEELISELTESLQNPEINIWLENGFSQSFENHELFFSADFFLHSLLAKYKKSRLAHFDLDQWFVITGEINDRWMSPWGSLKARHPQFEKFTLQPFCEMHLNQIGHMDFSKTPAPTEPGPMIAGRSVKSLVVDTFYKELAQNESLQQLFPLLTQSNLMNKIESQFIVLEKGQRQTLDTFTNEKIVGFIKNKIRFDLAFASGYYATTETKDLLWTGHLAFLFQSKKQSSADQFSWTKEIFDKVYNL